MRLMRWLAAAVMVAASASAAGAQSSDALQSFGRADFKAALDAVDATYSDVEGMRNLEITFNGSILADGLLLACDDEESETNCYGTSILATFEPNEGTTEAQITEAVNKYNYLENFGRAYVDPDGVISVRMYIIADGGIARENYEAQLSLFVSSLTDFFGYLYPE